MALFPYRRLAGFYFFYFAYLSAFGPFFSLYLKDVGLSPVEIGIVMALPQVARIVAPHLWGWLADSGAGRMRVVRITTAIAIGCWLGMFASTAFLWICAVMLAMTFFFSAALPLLEVTTLGHLGEETGRYGRVRLWGSIGYIVAVIGVGHALDFFRVDALLWIVLALMVGTLLCASLVPEAPVAAHHENEPGIVEVLRRPEVIALIAACALMAMAHGPYYTFYSIHVVNHGYSKGITGWLWALGVVCEIGIFFWMPHLYRAFSLRAILIASFAIAAVRFLMIGWAADNTAVLILAQTLHAATFGSFHAAAIGLVHKFFRGRHQARGQAVYASLSFGLGGMIGSLASGYAWEAWGAAATYTLASACACAGMLILWWKLDPAGPAPRAA